MECRVDEMMVRGSHNIFVGRVVSTSVQGTVPLVYHNGSYGSFSEAELTPVPQVRTPELQCDANLSCE